MEYFTVFFKNSMVILIWFLSLSLIPIHLCFKSQSYPNITTEPMLFVLNGNFKINSLYMLFSLKDTHTCLPVIFITDAWMLFHNVFILIQEWWFILIVLVNITCQVVITHNHLMKESHLLNFLFMLAVGTSVRTILNIYW